MLTIIVSVYFIPMHDNIRVLFFNSSATEFLQILPNSFSARNYICGEIFFAELTVNCSWVHFHAVIGLICCLEIVDTWLKVRAPWWCFGPLELPTKLPTEICLISQNLTRLVQKTSRLWIKLEITKIWFACILFWI